MHYCNTTADEKKAELGPTSRDEKEDVVVEEKKNNNKRRSKAGLWQLEVLVFWAS